MHPQPTTLSQQRQQLGFFLLLFSLHGRPGPMQYLRVERQDAAYGPSSDPPLTRSEPKRIRNVVFSVANMLQADTIGKKICAHRLFLHIN
jgi:hypothetical protein